MRSLLSFLILSLLCSTGFAQPPQTQLILGDGAAVCAEAKSSRAHLLVEPARSVASSNIDVTYYHLDLDIDLVAKNIDGVVRIEGTVTGTPMSVLTLDFDTTMVVSSVNLPDATVLTFSHINDSLNITLPAPVTPGNTVQVDVAYSGTPSTGGFGYFVFGTHISGRFAWSLSEPYGARNWWPCKDHPHDKADSVRVTVTVPSLYQVGSQGTLVSETINGGNTTYDWLSHYPISSYLVSVAIGNYVSYPGTYTRPASLEALYGPLSMPLQDLVYDDVANGQPNEWALVGDMIEVFEEWYGPYPFADEKYGHAETTFGGGMEHQTMSSMGASTVGLVSHELAHQWFGDEISPRTWPHLWLNEGFATFSELVYWEERAATYPGTYENYLTSRYNTAKSASGTLVLEDTTSVNYMFSYSRVYAKGAVVLNMLRYVIGDSLFKATLRTYAADAQVEYGVASTNDFKRVAETVSGIDLDSFFDQWVVTGTGYPTYQLNSFWQPSAGGYTVWASVLQTQVMPQSNVYAFEMPLVIAVQTTAGEERFLVYNDQRTQNYQLFVSSEPTTVTIDPDKAILRTDNVATGMADNTPLPYPIRSLSPNPVSESMRLEFSVSGEVFLEVYDVAGRRVMDEVVFTSRGGVTVLDTSNLSSGVYFLRTTTATAQATRKFAVVR